MKTLERQLADYGERQRELHGPISPDELTVTLGRSDQKAPMRPHPRRGLWIAVTAAAATLVGFGLIPLLMNTDTPSSVADTVTPGAWSRIPHDEAVFGGDGEQNMFGATVGGPGLVAVGATGGWFGDGDAAVWTSVDGITWNRVTHDEEVFGGANSQTMWDVAVADFGLVAVGWDGQGILTDSPDVDAAIWTSVDGDTWLRVPHDEEVFGGAWITSVTAGGPGLVAVGGTDGYFTDGDAVVWTSADGITWSRVPHDEEVFGGEEAQVINDVTVGGPGLVAVGHDGGIGPWDNNADTTAAVWTSVDGANWTRVPHDETVFGTGGNPSMLAVTAGGPGLVAVGADYAGLSETPVWTSPDGITWTRVPDDETVRGSMTSVAAGASGLVAVGAQATVWTSVDGITWSRVPNDDAIFGSDWVFTVTVGGPGLVAVGHDSGDAATWVWEAEKD